MPDYVLTETVDYLQRPRGAELAQPENAATPAPTTGQLWPR